MLRWESGRVIAHRRGWPGVASLQVEVTGADGAPETLRALAYTELVGTPQVGETVDLNTNALRRGLGTGGDAIVVSRRDDSPDAAEIAGHMMKLRYTPMQTMVDALDDPASPHYARISHARDVEGMPVVVADLHSSLAPIVAGIRAEAPSARIVYVMTDGAALPAAYSRTLAALRERGLITASVTAGQAFGGDLEAVTVHSALLGARHVLEADVAVVIQGPGNLGTGTGWGFSGVQAGDVLNAAGVLGGAPIGALRVSEADERARHRGLSHHSATAYGRMTLVPARFPVLAPRRAGDWVFHAQVTAQVEQLIIEQAARRGLVHELVEVPDDGLLAALQALPVRLSTMGRGLEEDPASFVYGALAGRAAASLIV
ncbi:DUF3866 family protein [Brachybacterium phenoliresistens]|uniref:DUF3866 family protein n=1 Tax=Brachybacterium phenoliresistens TaxID=396014 RepID=UPI0031D49975